MRKRNPLFFIMFLAGTILLSIGCGGDDDNPVSPANYAPEIESVESSMDTLNATETTTLTCNATDAENEALTYTWSSTSGSFPNGTSGESVDWQAPDITGSYTINVKVKDTADSTSSSIDIFVRTGSTGIMPLREGNYWNYDFHSQGIIVGECRWEVSSAIATGTETWYQVDVTFVVQGDTENTTFYMTNRNDGCYEKETLTSTPALWWKFPAVEDDTWLSVDGEMRIVVDTNETATVPDGTYTGCMGYGVIGAEELVYETVKPSVGPVELAALIDGEISVVLKLKDININ